MPDAIPLANVQNIGPKSADALARAGLTTLSQLQQMGAVAAYVKVKGANTNITLNMCRRQFKIDHLCQLNFDQGSKAGCLAPGCG